MIKGNYFHRVVYSETDKMGFMHHSNYARMYENARWELFREHGISYKSIEDSGILMPVIDMQVHYSKPAFYDDLLKIEVNTEIIGGTKIKFKYSTYNQQNVLINTGSMVLAFIRETNNRPVRVPPKILDVFAEIEV